MNGTVVTFRPSQARKIAHMRASYPRRLAGFTLIELMVAVTIACILAAVAYPALTSFIQRSRRADAIAALTVIAQAQERLRSNRPAYASSFDDLKLDPAKLAANYTFELVGVGDPASFVSGYEAKASVKAGSVQDKDSDCATLSMRSEGAMLTYLAKDKIGNDTKDRCWSR